MPKKGRNKKGRCLIKPRDTALTLGETTLNDFANNKDNNKNAPRRMNVNCLVKQVKKIQVSEDDRAWDEKDEEEFDNDKEGNGDPEENEITLQTGPYRRRKRTNLDSSINFEGDGINYPLDIWFIISEKIKPDDVGRFAAICQATYYIVTTARFWFSLYKRNHKWVPELPKHLNYWNMDQVYGLRASVIRSLYYMYMPFSKKITSEKTLSADPTYLQRSQCLLQWQKKSGCQHKYFFKFFHPSCVKKLKSSVSRQRNPDILESDSLVQINPDEGCYILEAKCLTINAWPMVMGEYLHHAGIGISANLCHHRLRLSLSPQHLLPSGTKAQNGTRRPNITEILLEPVADVRVYPWWHPQYLKNVRTT